MSAREEGPSGPMGEASSTRARRWRGLRLVAGAFTALLVATSPWWGPMVLSRLAFFHVRRVEFEGVRYGRVAEFVALLRVDTLQSVWQPLPPLAARIRQHPLLADAVVARKLPGTLVIQVTERDPVALTPIDGRLEPVDGTQQVLPIDPVRAPLDVPIVVTPDSALLRFLSGLRQSAPALYARVITAEPVGREEFRLVLDSVRVRTRADVTVARFRDILPVEADLVRLRQSVAELDLRFRDQVIAR